MKKAVVFFLVLAAAVGCAATGVMQQALVDAGGGLVWKAIAAYVSVTSWDSVADDSLARYEGTDGTKIRGTGIFVDDNNDVGINSADSSSIAARLHVHNSGDSILTPSNTVFAVQDNDTDATNCISAFSSGADGKSILYFGEPLDYDRGAFEFDCATDDMTFWSTDDVILEGDNLKFNGLVNGIRLSYQTTAGGYSLLDTDYFLSVTAAGYTVIPPALSGHSERANKVYVIKAAYAAPANATLIDPADGSIDGSATYSLTAGRTVTIVNDGTNWWTF